MHAYEIDSEDGDQSGKKRRMYSTSLRARNEQAKCEETNRDMQSLSRNLVSVDETAPFAMQRDQAQRTRTPTQVAPITRAHARTTRIQMSICFNRLWWRFGDLSCRVFLGEFGTSASGSGAAAFWVGGFWRFCDGRWAFDAAIALFGCAGEVAVACGRGFGGCR